MVQNKPVRKTASPRATTGTCKSFFKIQDVKLELERRGKGKPLLLLQGEETHEADMAFVDELARTHQVLIPWPPGYGRSSLPNSIQNMDDIAYLYLELLDRLELGKVSLLGFSMGGWIAAEMATKDCARLGKMILVDPYGIKTGGASKRDIQDIYYLSAQKIARLKFHDPNNDPYHFPSMPARAVARVARHRETTARLCWEPYMHNPKLKPRLGRISIPTLVLWGAGDGIVRPSYGRAYAKAIPKARFKLIEKAGHLPHIEQPAVFMREVRRFLAT